jgi:GT2 family glycosyltransferase
MTVSVVVLTFNRTELLRSNLTEMYRFRNSLRDIIVVDNSTQDGTAQLIRTRFPEVTYVHNETNIGIAGRNIGMRLAEGDIIATLDDDVMGLSIHDIEYIQTQFARDHRLGALCFRVLDYSTHNICNWCHHRRAELDGLGSFLTYEISEGAVAFRREALLCSGYYYEKLFISHEGRDLAYRLMNHGYAVKYDGNIAVYHHHAKAGRTSWRRYYYDTRNAIWIAVRNMPFAYALRYVALTLVAMAIYSLRDGYISYWAKAVKDGLMAWREIYSDRTVWNDQTRRWCREIDSDRPHLFYMIKKRLLRKGIGI